jgi:anti-anti-sigma regulatory factor
VKKAKGMFCLIEPNEYVLDVLEVVGLAKLMTIYPTETDFERQVP